MRAQVLRWGNSLAVRIPKAISEEANLRVGDPLEIQVDGDGSVQMYPAREIPSLAELVSQITPENRYPEISGGREVGKEIIEW